MCCVLLDALSSFLLFSFIPVYTVHTILQLLGRYLYQQILTLKVAIFNRAHILPDFLLKIGAFSKIINFDFLSGHIILISSCELIQLGSIDVADFTFMVYKQTNRQTSKEYFTYTYTNTVHTSLIFLYEDVEANISVPGAKTIYSGAIKRLFSSTINHSVFSVFLFINFCLYQFDFIKLLAWLGTQRCPGWSTIFCYQLTYYPLTCNQNQSYSFTINSVVIICYQASFGIQPQLLSTYLLSSLTCYQANLLSILRCNQQFAINHHLPSYLRLPLNPYFYQFFP